MKKEEIISKITTAVVKAMKENPEEWTKPWAGHSGLPHNPITGTVYTGGNSLILTWFSPEPSDPRWSTYKGWESRGIQVNKGEKATHITFYNQSWKNDSTGKWSKTQPANPDGWRKVGILRGYPVFHASQTEGAGEWEQPHVEDLPVEAHREWFKTIGADWIEKPIDMAYYSPGEDHIVTPESTQFHSVAGWFGTVAHEHVHWTGAKTRLGREKDSYAFEELVAELGATFLACIKNIETEPRPDHISYIKSWLKALDDDPAFIWKAAGQASKAVNYILENSEDKEKQEVK